MIRLSIIYNCLTLVLGAVSAGLVLRWVLMRWQSSDDGPYVILRACTACGGSGICPTCEGAGCEACGYTRDCMQCGGSGEYDAGTVY